MAQGLYDRGYEIVQCGGGINVNLCLKKEACVWPEVIEFRV